MSLRDRARGEGKDADSYQRIAGRIGQAARSGDGDRALAEAVNFKLKLQHDIRAWMQDPEAVYWSGRDVFAGMAFAFVAFSMPLRAGADLGMFYGVSSSAIALWALWEARRVGKEGTTWW